MAIDQDHTAPVTREEITETLSKDLLSKAGLVERILRCLNEKRDAYNGVISSLIYMIDENNDEILNLLKHGLRRFVAVHPMRFGGKVFTTRCLPRLIMERPKFIATFFSELIQDSHLWGTKITNESDTLRLKIVAIRAIEQAEQRVCEKLTTLTSHQIDAICDESMIKGDSQTKLDTLYILLDTKFSTKVVTDRELDIYIRFYREALDLQVPALRQKFLAITSKLIKRVKDSMRVVWRETERFPEPERREITERYMKFLHWLIKFCLDNTYSNKYFGSIIITTTTLDCIIEHITLSDSRLPVASWFHVRRFYDSILNCLVLDTFEDNKKLALKLLFALQLNGHTIDDHNMNLLVQKAYQLVDSVNPAHSLTCQYIFRLVIGYEQIKSNEHKNVLVYKHLDNLVCLVEDGIQAAENDFLGALKQNAIYPKMTCIRALLSEISSKDLEKDRSRWMELARRLVAASVRACQSVSSIVCNMNPETIGHLPMDLEPIDIQALTKNLDKSVKISQAHISTVTSQHLLITGWKTIKECSLSMGALCAQLWWPKNAELGEPILEPGQIRLIVEFFKHYLRNLRHRGAFEQAYNGFTMVTKKIWLDDSLRDLLIADLTELLNDFRQEQSMLGDKKVEYLRKHVTRRSAGLPFLVQAIAISEDRRDSRTFRFIVDTLIGVMDSSQTETYQKIHCLNILKALTNDFNLAEKVTPYLGQIFVITIEAFKSDDFSIRNCANMLMRALVDRCFGVSRSRDEIHKRNTLSYEKFFSEYPDLHAKMAQYLRDGLKDKRSLASVHAVYIILAHLKPSINAGEKYSIEKMVGPYIETILQLALSCSDLKLRDLSARMLVRLEIQLRGELTYDKFQLFDEYQSMISSRNWLNRIKTESNSLHGLLCMLRHWVENRELIDNVKLQNQLQLLVNTVIELIMEIGFDDGTNFLRLSAIDLCESCCLVGQVSTSILRHDWSPTELLPSEETSSLCNQMVSFENLAFRSISLSLMTPEDSRDPSKKKKVIKTMMRVARRPSDRIFSINFQASLIRFLRQFFSQEEDFIDKLVTNFDLDSTAAQLTPIDKLNQRSELDSERELWLRYCEQPALRRQIRDEISEECLDELFALTKYEEFRPDLGGNSMKANTPRSIELLVFVCKAWDHFNLEERCIWSKVGETTTDKLRTVTKLIRNLPDCDIKCLILLCASRLFHSLVSKIHRHFGQTSASITADIVAAKEFSAVIEELADGHHSRNIRETSSEILNTIQDSIIGFWCEPLKETLMNIFSALIKLYQDEEHEVRESISRGLIKFYSKHSSISELAGSSGSCFENLIVFITERLLDPSDQHDASRYLELLIRVIFNHSKSSSIDLGQDRESLFDRTRMNVFADHVAIIERTLAAAETFFSKTFEPIDLDGSSFPSDVLDELSTSEIQAQVNHGIGDYSWRSKSEPNPRICESRVEQGKVERNRERVDGALRRVGQSLTYFNCSNMLVDTSFGFHESALFKQLAFVKLLLLGTNYRNEQLLGEIRHELELIIETSCGTSILVKCYELLD